ncbi:Gibberellin 20-oxidase-like protein [Camellia lanceoleosa]|uniref:Gibberellin 20-oxidase-like protein n=1 Tax=Camellia lanceoleosa TaxID=1840588 RepID=A0ACC0G7D5_9ERIC|nr:Gibberellin 20-oxidase-like protein [Camellia lanceoleosa]
MMSDESHTSLQLPIIDIFLPLQSPSSLLSLSQACKEWGFFHISNHGVSKELYSKVRSLSEYLFSLPVETKTKHGPLSSVKTYTPHCIASAFFESLGASGPDFAASAQSPADVLFHHHNFEFSQTINSTLVHDRRGKFSAHGISMSKEEDLDGLYKNYGVED